MLTVKNEYRKSRAVLTGPQDAPTGARLARDDRFRVVKVTVDYLNRTIFAHLERGHEDQGKWCGSGEVVSRQIDTHDGHDDPRKRQTWDQLDHKVLDRAMEAIEDVIRKAAFLEEVERLPTDPPEPMA